MRSCASRRERAWSTALHSNPLDGGGRVGEHLLMDERELIYDWNRAGGEGGPAFDWSRVHVDLNDETLRDGLQDRKSTRLNSSHGYISYAVFRLKKKNTVRALHRSVAP